MLPITTIVNVTVAQSPAGLAPVNVNNLLVLTDDTPVVSMGSAAYKVYNSATAVGTDWGITSKSYKAALDVFSQSPNILTGGGVLIIAPLLNPGTVEATDAAITRLAGLVYFGGVATAYTTQTTTLSAVAAVCQALQKLYFVVSSTEADLTGPSGIFFVTQSASDSYVRMLFHHDAAQTEHMKWAYAGRAMSVDFTASNTTLNMQLKQLAGVTADETLTAAFLAIAASVGVDCYGDIQGRSSLITSGANGFYDNVYNLLWLQLTLGNVWFNTIATTTTKVPQTETAMTYLKSNLQQVCALSVLNGMTAPGTWTSSDTFGDPATFRQNISVAGYYLYSLPVAQQLAADRALRKAPTVQIAVKLAGGINTGNVIVNFNV